MADRRKLQAEIDRCLKRVSEGVEAFEDTWQKVYSATNANQKDKFEADLKKEIKKLQRLRDQIKSWLTSSDIKDKKPLQDARKLIEMQMERFKVVEKETKTKAYSKEGLVSAQKLDPAQKEREEITSWLTACIECLNIQVDKFESEIDTINFSLKKKKNDKEKLDRLDELKIHLGKHKYHINQLEALLRMLDNGTVEVDQIKKIKDDVEYYKDCSQDPDFQENEYIYDDLNLEDMEMYLAKQQAAYQQTQLDLKSSSVDEDSTAVPSTPKSTDSNSPSHSPNSGVHTSESSSSVTKTCKVPDSLSSTPVKRTSSPVNVNSMSTKDNSSSPPRLNLHNSPSVIDSQLSSTPSVTAPSAVSSNQMSSNHDYVWSSTSFDEECSNDVNIKSSRCPNSCTESTHSSTLSSSSESVSNSWMDSDYFPEESDLSSRTHCENNNQIVFNNSDNKCSPVSEDKKSVLHSNGCQSDTSTNSVLKNLLEQCNSLNVSSRSVISGDSKSTLKNLAERAVVNSGINHIHNLQIPSLQSTGSSSTHNDIGYKSSNVYSDGTPSSLNLTSSTCCTDYNTYKIFGDVPTTYFSPEHMECLRILDGPCKRLPLTMDSLRFRHYGPGRPAATPDYYPKNASNSHSAEFFQRLSTETLFFIFYFLQGTRAQYLAAKTLKTKSWRFHTMFMMWFQRNEEPKTITDEYEQGTYIYFDFEKWAQRKKEGFTFEYKYLEDKDLN